MVFFSFACAQVVTHAANRVSSMSGFVMVGLVLLYWGMRESASARKFPPPGQVFDCEIELVKVLQTPSLLGREFSRCFECFQIFVISPNLERDFVFFEEMSPCEELPPHPVRLLFP